jgi:hypothetical protein
MRRLFNFLFFCFFVYCCFRFYNNRIVERQNTETAAKSAKNSVAKVKNQFKPMIIPSSSPSPKVEAKEDEIDDRYAYNSVDLRFNNNDLEVVHYQKNSVLTKIVKGIFWREHIQIGDTQVLSELQDLVNSIVVRKYQDGKAKGPFTLSKLQVYQDEAFDEGLKKFNEQKRIEEAGGGQAQDLENEAKNPQDQPVDPTQQEDWLKESQSPPQTDVQPETPCSGEGCMSPEPTPENSNEANVVQSSEKLDHLENTANEGVALDSANGAPEQPLDPSPAPSATDSPEAVNNQNFN